MSKKILLLIISVFLFNTFLFSQDELEASPMLSRYYSEQKKDNNLDEQVNLILKGNVKEIERIVNRNGGMVKFYRSNLVSVRVPLRALKPLSESNEIKPIHFSIEKGKALNDTMRLRTKVNQVHQSQMPLRKPYTGKNVLVGFVDTGIDYTHPDFQNPDGSTRILAIWDHTKPYNVNYTPIEYGYGQMWDSAQINSGFSTHGINGAYHGSTVAGAASGNGLASGDNMGVAPESSIVMVETNFSLPNWYASIVDAVDFIFSIADEYNLPCVINTSVGGYLGSHDGLDVESLLINELLNEKSGRLLVSSAGNSGDVKYHVRMDLYKETDTMFTWFKHYSPGDYAYIDVWSDTNDFSSMKFAIGADKVTPNYEFRGRTEFKNLKLDDMIDKLNPDSIVVDGVKLADIQYFVSEDNGRYELEVYMPSPDSSQYNFRFITTGIGACDIWGGEISRVSDLVYSPTPSLIEFKDIESYVYPDSSKTIITSWACLSDVVTVGNYINADRYTDYFGASHIEPLNQVGELKGHSSKGSTRNGLLKPDISAPGDFIFSVSTMADISILLSLSHPNLHRSGWHVSNGGTSMASPVVAGIGALLLERCPNLTPQKFKEIITSTAFQDKFTGSDLPNNEWGYGKVDAFAALVSTLFSPTISDVEICDGETISYSSQEVFSKYQWHNGVTTPVIEISSDLSGYLITENAFGCISDTSFFKATVNPLPDVPEISVDAGNLIGEESVAYQWYINGEELSGETNQQITATQAGDYKLEVFNKFGCSTLSNPVTVNRPENGFVVYPNPASDVFNVQINTGDILNIKMLDILGKIIFDKENVSEDFTIDTQNLESATYFLIVDNNGVQTTSKISVVKD